jgi:hypothetical protein
MRKLTGKAAEIAALLIRLPLDVDFFKPLENDLLEDGLLNQTNRAFITETLRQIPFLASPDELRQKLEESRGWYLSQWIEVGGLDPQSATQKVDATIASLLSGWRNPVLRRTTASGQIVEECGVPLRAMMAYLYAEVAKNFYLIHHPEEWIEWVTRSQWGDRCFDIDARKLPSRKDMESLLAWEKGWSGPALMERWLARFQARPFDYQRGLDDKSLSNSEPPEFHKLEGGNFFRGLALIDLAEAMLKRAFGEDAVAMRVNAAGQGDYFQVHVDTQKVAIEEVKQFLRLAFYRRFGLSPEPDFVEIHPGGGAVGVRLNRYDSLSHLVQKLKSLNR